MTQVRWKTIVPLAAPLLTVVLLAGAAHSLEDRHPVQAVRYHQRVRSVADKAPHVIGDWFGRDVPVPAPAIRILKPNVLISRDYQNLLTNQNVNVMLVQSRDAYDMMFHYPPVCFPAHGWSPQWHQQRQWSAGQRTFGVMEYGFQQKKLDGNLEIIVANFFVTSTGMALEMSAVKDAARDPSRRPYGAAQVQFLFDAKMKEQDRHAIFAELVQGLVPVIDEIQKPAAGSIAPQVSAVAPQVSAVAP